MKRLITSTLLIVASAVCGAILFQFASQPTRMLADEPPRGLPVAIPVLQNAEVTSWPEARPAPPPLPVVKSPTQVLLAVKFYSLDIQKLREAGIGLPETLGLEHANSDNVYTGPRATQQTHAKSSVLASTVSPRERDVITKLLTLSGAAKLLAEPTIVTMDGREAQFNSGGEFPIVAPQGEGKVSVDYRSFGTKLNFKPHILSDGKLRLEIRAEHSVIDEERSVKVGDNRVPGLRTRWIDTAMVLRAGQTGVLGGLQNDSLLVMITPELMTPQNALGIASAASDSSLATKDDTTKSHKDWATAVQALNESSNVVRENAKLRVRPLQQHLGPRHPDVANAQAEVKLHALRDSERRAATESERARAIKEFSEITHEMFPDAAIKVRSLANSVILSGSVASPDEAFVVEKIALEFFPNVIDNLDIIGTFRSDEASNAHRMQEVLVQLFPDTPITVHPLNNSVVLSGTVEKDSAEQIVRIAEDFYPEVIDHMRHTGADSAPRRATQLRPVETTPAKPTSLSGEILQLREDVRILRRDVQRLLEILERKPKDAESADHAKLDESSSAQSSAAEGVAWEVLGIRVKPTKMKDSRYRGGLSILAVREDSPAAKEEIRAGDVLVGLDKWETLDQKNLGYALQHAKENAGGQLKFFVLRGTESLSGNLKLDAWPSQKKSDAEYRSIWRLSLEDAIAIALGKRSDLTLAGREGDPIETQNVVGNVEEVYWKLWAAQRDLEAGKRARDAARELWNRVRDDLDDGRESGQSEAQARVQYFFFRDSVAHSLSEVHSREQELRKILGLALTDGRLISPSDEPDTAKVKFDWEETLATALASSPELQQQQRTVQRVESKLLKLKAAQDSLHKVLEHSISFGAAGPVVDVPGVELGLPVGFRRELAGIRHAELNLARETAREKDIRLNLSNRLTRDFRKLNFAYNSLKTHTNRRAAVKDELDASTTSHANGNVSLDLVLDAQRRFFQSELDYHAAVAEYAIAVKNVHAWWGSLLAERNITLVEPPSAATPSEHDATSARNAPAASIPDPTARLKPGDRLLLESLTDERLNRRVTILGDGSITLPLLEQISAAGRTLQELKKELEEQYKRYYKQPSLMLSFEGTSLPAR